jgi:hypothetical protein
MTAMDTEFVWLKHPDTGGYFRCPAAAVEDWLANGWEVADEPPAESNPVTAENLAWREQQDQAATKPAKQNDKPTTKVARRGAQNGDMSDG